MRSVKHSEAARRNVVKAYTAVKERAVENYYKAPNTCKQCGVVMQLKEGQQPAVVKAKKFCSHSCSAIQANKSPNRPVSSNRRPCPFCGIEIKNKGTKSCLKCSAALRHELAGLLTKGAVSRERISAHARRVLKNALSCCRVCGYSFAVEAAHIKAVKEFSSDSLVKDINEEKNLIPLCPNHHLEFDRGKISLQDILCAADASGSNAGF